MITVAFADVAILAASRNQAGKLLSQLTGYIKRSPELREQLRIKQRIVHCDRTDGKVAVLAADSDTLDGWGGTLALVDELGRPKTSPPLGTRCTSVPTTGPTVSSCGKRRRDSSRGSRLRSSTTLLLTPIPGSSPRFS